MRVVPSAARNRLRRQRTGPPRSTTGRAEDPRRSSRTGCPADRPAAGRGPLLSREFFTYTRDEFLEELVHPDDRVAVEDAREKRTLHVRSEYLAEIRRNAGLAQGEVADATGITQQRVSAIENGSVAELSTRAPTTSARRAAN